jgi:hypothetical protein
VGIFRSKLVLPWFVGLVVLLQEDSLELVLAYVRQKIHCIWEARLSLLSEAAMELCCNLGSIIL